MSATNTELEQRLYALEVWKEQLQQNTVQIPTGAVGFNETAIPDKTGWIVYGKTPNINGNKFVMGRSLTANPTEEEHFEQPLIFKAL